jgi:protein SEY1
LALSEILIINMWTHHVGLHDAANYGLLKVVFELNLQLFQSSQKAKNKTLLLFLFRDHVQTGEDSTPLDYFIDVISGDMGKIWATISKPEQYAASSITDFFDFEFVSLPHKQHTPDQFDQQCGQLRERFLRRDHPKKILDQAYKKDIPADGFSRYAEDIWSAIQSNKDINLPSQKEMLAMYRCEEIMNLALKEFLKQVDELKKPLLESSKTIPDFSAKSTTLVDAALDAYDNQAKRYHADVFKQKRTNLLERAGSELERLFHDQVKLITSQSLNDFEDVLKQKFAADAPTPQFLAVLRQVQEEQAAQYTARVSSCLVARFEWNFKAAVVEFEEAVKRRLESTRSQQADLHVQEVSSAFRTKLESELQTILTKATRPQAEPADLKVWPKVAAMVRDLSTESQQKLRVNLEEIGAATEEVDRRVTALVQGISDLVKHRVRGALGTKLAGVMEARVASKFANDPRGGSRRWGPMDDVHAAFAAAKDEAMEVLQQFTVLRMDEQKTEKLKWLQKRGNVWEVDADASAVPAELAIFSRDEVEQIYDQFEKASRAMLDAALRDQESAKYSSQTFLIVGFIFLVFGWNEIMYILSNPLILILVVLLGAVAAVVTKLGQWQTIAPFVIPTLKVGYQAALNAANTVIVKLMDSQGGQRPSMATAGAADSGKSKRD